MKNKSVCQKKTEEEEDEEAIVMETRAVLNGFIQAVQSEAIAEEEERDRRIGGGRRRRGKNQSQEDDLRIPRLFFSLYFGGGALIYTLLTIWVFFACCLSDHLPFGQSGVYYMLWIAILMWLSTGLTVAIGKFVQDFRSKEQEGQFRRKRGGHMVLSLCLKLVTDGVIFFGLVEALRDPHLVHYNDFHQFAGPLIYYGLLYLVTVIEVIVFILTVLLVEDPCHMFDTIEMLIEYKNEFVANHCAIAEDV